MSDERGRSDGSKRTQFQAGQSGNPTGKKSTQSLKDVAAQHGAEIDDTGPKKRARFRRVLDKIYERALGDTNFSQKAAEEYCARVAGKPITPVDVTGTVTHQSVEAHVTSILENLDRLKEAPKPPQPVTDTLQ